MKRRWLNVAVRVEARNWQEAVNYFKEDQTMKTKKSDTKNSRNSVVATPAEKAKAERHLNRLIGDLEVREFLALPSFKRVMLYAILGYNPAL